MSSFFFSATLSESFLSSDDLSFFLSSLSLSLLSLSLSLLSRPLPDRSLSLLESRSSRGRPPALPPPRPRLLDLRRFLRSDSFLSRERERDELELELELLDEPLDEDELLLDEPLELLELSRRLFLLESRSDRRSLSRLEDPRSLSILRFFSGEEARLELELRLPGISP